jgi:predicted secreted protein
MALAGKNGSVYFGSTPKRLEQVSSWSMDMKTDTVDCTNMDGNGWKEFLSTFKSWTGKVECEFDMDDLSGQLAFFNAWVSGEILALKLKLDATHGFECSGTISAVGVSTAVADKVKMSYEIQGTAGITYNPAMA